MGQSGESVTVPFYVNGAVKVSRTYSWVTGWRELTRQVAADLGNAPGLQLRPVTVKVGGDAGTVCVDTGSPNGSVVIHFHEYPEGAREGSLMDLLMTPVKVTRHMWQPLSEPYPFERVAAPQ